MQTIPANSPDQVSQPFRTEDNAPDPTAIRAQLLFSAEQAVGEINRQWRNETTRFCRWPGQRDDGRKDKGAKVEPFPGASDVRVRLADMVIKDDVSLLMTAARDGRLVVQGTESGVMADAAKTTTYLNWLRNVRMAANVERETRLAAEGRQTFGYMVMGVTWHQQWARDYETITIDAIQQGAQQDPQGPMAQLAAAVFTLDSATQRALVSLLQKLYPDLERRDAYKQLAALRTTGEMKMPVRYLLKNEPMWKALRPWRDWFGPLNTFDSPTARWQAEREVLNAQELDAKRAEGWSEEFIEGVRGTMGFSVILYALQREGAGSQPYRDRMEEMRGLCEVFYVYYWHTDDQGVPCLYRTVTSPWMNSNGKDVGGAMVTGPDGPLGYDCGRYPFVFFPVETCDRYLVDARGQPELLMTNQNEIKHFRDAANNSVDLALQPPLIRPEREIGLPLAIKPRGEIGFRRTGQSSFMTVPQLPQAAAEMPKEILAETQRYLARDREIDPVRCAAREKELVAGWCTQIADCWKLTLQLAQQFTDNIEFQRVTGGQTETIQVGRDEIQGDPHLQLTFNTASLDPAQMEAKVNIFQSIQGLDRYGTLNGAPIIAELIGHFFPEVSDAALRNSQQASAHEIKDTADILGRILGAGIEPDYAENGQNFALRLQWLQQQLAQPATVQSMRQSPDKAALAGKYYQHLQFMVQQQTNAQTGRVGVAPAPVGVPDQPAAAAA